MIYIMDMQGKTINHGGQRWSLPVNIIFNILNDIRNKANPIDPMMTQFAWLSAQIGCCMVSAAGVNAIWTKEKTIN